jgi:CHAD domain-containing protein
MASSLKTRETVGRGIDRLLRREIDKALDELARTGEQDETIHKVRKRCKKIRALLRLVWGEVGRRAFRRENSAIRDAVRPLTAVRDATVLVGAFDELLNRRDLEEDSDQTFSEVRNFLEMHRRSVRDSSLTGQRTLDVIIDRLHQARIRIPQLRIAGNGWASVRDGLMRAYRAGRHARDLASASSTVENLHEWRKQVKYFGHQLAVLGPLGHNALRDFASDVRDLGQLLGDDHDLAMLLSRIATYASWKHARDITSLLHLIERRRNEMRRRALELGQEVYRHKPKTAVRRLKGLLDRLE